MRDGRETMQRSPALALALGVLVAAGVPAAAAERSVTIIEGIEEPLPKPMPPPADAVPLVPLKTENPAGMALNILPNGILPVGTKIAFSVSTQRVGYLILVDINAAGRWTQIYPNMLSLSRAAGDVATANMIRPGPPATIPNSRNPLARFVFTADPPLGNGAIMAILSDRPVQIIDLPEAPSTPLNLQTAIDSLSQSIAALKIATTTTGEAFSSGVWSFAAAPYAIK